MPTQSSLICAKMLDGRTQDKLASTSDGASIPGPPHSSVPASGPVLCFFCDEAFCSQEELGRHLLADHPTSLHEPAVLRVDAEFRIPGEQPRVKASDIGGPAADTQQLHSCIVCGQVAQDAAELEAHMRKHKDYFTYCCDLCGRRFREPWFLKNHMKMHSKQSARSRAQQAQEAPATLNGVVQDPAPDPVVTPYKMCMVCGFLFPNHDALAEHSKVHNRGAELGKDEREAADDDDGGPPQSCFLSSLGLRPSSAPTPCQGSSARIPQLDPFTTYQAWQLATKGKVAVGRNTTKGGVQDGSTDNEDCISEKDGSGGSHACRQHPVATSGRTTRRSSLMQKVKDKDRPTTCEECHRTFRTYHQLVLHSRVHSRDRGGEESPSPLDGKLLDQSEDGSEEGSEETGLAEGQSPGEESDRSKLKSKKCTYCGKSFRSSYYLTIHLRTHTGEKPYKCDYCDYAAAQKTSLKYHLERRHKGKPSLESPKQPIPAAGENLPGGGAKSPLASTNSADGSLVGARSESLPPSPASSPPADAPGPASPGPASPTNLLEEQKEEQCGGPLNLSVKVSLCVAVAAEGAATPITCRFCTYKSIYPEVLIVHTRLAHKANSDTARRSSPAPPSDLKRKRLTGCPPALYGKDVGPVEAYVRRYPRRTKSPPPTGQEQSAAVPPLPKRSVRPTDAHDAGPEVKRPRHLPPAAPPPQQDSSRSLPRRPSSGVRYETSVPAPRPLPEETGHPAVRGAASWHTEAARLCMPSHFGTLPSVDFGAPACKRLKYMSDAGERPSFTGSFGGGASVPQVPGRAVKGASKGGGPPPPLPDTFGSLKAAPSAISDAVLENEWNMMNLLHSYPHNDLASFYPGAPANPSHPGLGNPRAGGFTMLFQHLPNLPNSQRRDPSGLFPHQRLGPSDKSH